MSTYTHRSADAPATFSLRRWTLIIEWPDDLADSPTLLIHRDRDELTRQLFDQLAQTVDALVGGLGALVHDTPWADQHPLPDARRSSVTRLTEYLDVLHDGNTSGLWWTFTEVTIPLDYEESLEAAIVTGLVTS